MGNRIAFPAGSTMLRLLSKVGLLFPRLQSSMIVWISHGHYLGAASSLCSLAPF